MFKSMLIAVHLFWVTGCVTMFSDGSPEKPPQITADMPLDEMVEAGIAFGGETLKQVKKMIVKNKKQPEAGPMVRLQIIEKYKIWKTDELVNAVNLFQNLGPEKAEEIFLLLVKSDRPLAVDLAWVLAAGLPSQLMKQQIEAQITEYITNDSTGDELNDAFSSQMAEAIASNRMVESYSVVRQGLMQSHNYSFAKAMISLKPKQASNDFLDYLALAEPEELRQLTLATLNVITCNIILNHLAVYPADINHPSFNALFLFSISRNVALSELGHKALEAHIPENTQRIALMLSKMPTWVQIAYVNSVGRNIQPITKALLTELKDIAAANEVVDEINGLKM